MIVWGGRPLSLNPGGLYDPATNSWQPVSLTNAPVQRYFHSCAWTGSEMLVWGGALLGPRSQYDLIPGGGRYHPESNTWSSLESAGSPLPRAMKSWLPMTNSFFQTRHCYYVNGKKLHSIKLSMILP